MNKRVLTGKRLRIVAACAVAMALGALGAFALEESDFADAAKARLRHAFASQSTGDATRVETATLSTALHTLRVERLPIGRAWSLASVGADIVFSTRMGQIGYVTPGGRVFDLRITAPMGVEAFRQSGLAQNLLFEIVKFRVTDILAIETAPHRFNLFVAHHRYEPAGCFRLVVSRINLLAEGERLSADGPWAPVFQTRDCVAPKETGELFAGEQSGGRLIQLDSNHIALAVGDFELDGVNASRSVSQDEASDLGKLIGIDLRTGAARTLAMGLRNPQGLAITRGGELWETEHGPQGGDELNLIPRVRGAVPNLGWPNVTYGMAYAQRPTAWPLSAAASTHDGYLRPRFAFVPSVGISNLVEPDPRSFPNWNRHLLITSLRANTIFLARLEDDAVVYIEPISFSGNRLRDIIVLNDGRLAISTDGGAILIVSNADRDQPQPMQLTGLSTMPPLLEEEGDEPDSELRREALAYSWHCQQCHSLNGAAHIGPPLDTVIGRTVGAAPDYAYSEALSGQREHWTASRLRRFLEDPQGMYPGTAMPRPDAPDESLDRIVAFLQSREAMAQVRSQRVSAAH